MFIIYIIYSLTHTNRLIPYFGRNISLLDIRDVYHAALSIWDVCMDLWINPLQETKRVSNGICYFWHKCWMRLLFPVEDGEGSTFTEGEYSILEWHRMLDLKKYTLTVLTRTPQNPGRLKQQKCGFLIKLESIGLYIRFLVYIIRANYEKSSK